MRLLVLILVFFATTLRAEPPKVVTTIAPLYGIVSDLLRGITEPTLIVTKDTDPHNFSLSPSQVSALLNADVIFAMGGGMEPWLEQIELNPETKILYFSEGREFTSPPAQLPAGLSIRSLNQINTESRSATPDSFDPHVWVVETRNEVLTRGVVGFLRSNNIINSDQFQQIRQNYNDFVNSYSQAEATLLKVAQNLGDTPIVTTHDSLQYLDHFLGINIVGALSSVTGEQAGARSISRLTNIEGPVCLMIDVSEDASDLSALFPDWTQVRYDPMGYEFIDQPNYLTNLYLSLAAALESCITVS